MHRYAYVSALSVILFAGCGSSTPEDRCAVKGVVRYQGKPVPFGFITFISTTDAKNLIVGQIKPDGSYDLTPAPVGECKVKFQINNAYDPVAYQQAGKAEPQGQVIPRELGTKLADEKTTPFVRTLKPGENTIEFDIEKES
jgi:hypothetical protein